MSVVIEFPFIQSISALSHQTRKVVYELCVILFPIIFSEPGTLPQFVKNCEWITWENEESAITCP